MTEVVAGGLHTEMRAGCVRKNRLREGVVGIFGKVSS